MPKITFLGAGSAVFTVEIITDILATNTINSGVFALVDIDSERLELIHQVAELAIQQAGKSQTWSVEASTDLRTVLSGTDYLINTIEVAGLQNVNYDYEIPLKYGIDQCIGDTIGPGGIFKALRTLPTWLDILADIQSVAPQSTILSYTNPMSIMCLAGVRLSRLPIIGLCHSVQHTSHLLSKYLGIPYDEMNFKVGGINHLAWFVELSKDGKDLYPLLRKYAQIPEIYEQDPIRFEMMLQFGAFVTESSGHFSEYVPYFRKRADLVDRYTRSGYQGESGFYAKNWPRWRSEADAQMRSYIDQTAPILINRGTEYASYIIEAIETQRPVVIHGNVPNTGLIPNLPQQGIVEVACLIDGNGIQPTYFGHLPTQLAALDASHMWVHDLVVTAVIEQNRELAVHALMLDPLSAAVCSPSEIRQLFDEMAISEAAYLPEWVSKS